MQVYILSRNGEHISAWATRPEAEAERARELSDENQAKVEAWTGRRDAPNDYNVHATKMSKRRFQSWQRAQ